MSKSLDFSPEIISVRIALYTTNFIHVYSQIANTKTFRRFIDNVHVQRVIILGTKLWSQISAETYFNIDHVIFIIYWLEFEKKKWMGSQKK